VLRAIRELNAAGEPINRTSLVLRTGVPQTQVYVVLKWLSRGVPTWRHQRRKSSDYVISCAETWERQVAALWLGIDDVEDVGPVEVAAAFGDPIPETPDEEE
jgi:hypothetical protein